MPTRLVNLFVKSIALVQKPANNRKFLVIKTATEGSMHMRALTFEEVMEKNRRERDAARKTIAPATPTLTQVDLDRFESLVSNVLRGEPVEKAARSAVDALETLVAARIQAHPAETRQVAVAAIFQAHPELYDRVREETTLTSHGRTLREVYARAEAGTAAKSDTASVEAEVERRLDIILAKESRLTRAQAMQFAFRQDPALYERWQREAYA